jgi:hypothetical protein
MGPPNSSTCFFVGAMMNDPILDNGVELARNFTNFMNIKPEKSGAEPANGKHGSIYVISVVALLIK